VPVSALLLAGSAAFIHAGWNLVIARARDPQAAAAVAAAMGCAALVPVAVLTWDVDSAAAPYIAASALLHVVYFATLAEGYAVGDLSSVYPLARGSAPVLVLVVSVALLGARLSAAAVMGVIAVGFGVIAIRGLRGGADSRAIGLALLCGVTIAAYTLVDKEGLKHAAPVPYLGAMQVLPAAAYLALTLRLRGRAAVRGSVGPRTALAGLGMMSAYALVLAALKLAPAAPVSAVRETSVLIAVSVAAVATRERVSRGRLVGALAITGGIAAIALS
jgi:drug/metabolite transporter (DMT)-like permease